MRYDIAKLPVKTLLLPIAEVTAGLVRLDERVARSSVGQGWIERAHFADACASLWVDGELVQLEDLVLHDVGADIRAPTHELTIAHAVLRSRRRIAAHPPGWALAPDGLSSLRGNGGGAVDEVAGTEVAAGGLSTATVARPVGAGEGRAAEVDLSDPLGTELAAIDAVLARSEAALNQAKTPGRRTGQERDGLVYDLDWDEDERLEEWRGVVAETEGLPPVLRAALLLDAWNVLAVLQHAPWLGRLLAAACLRQAGATTATHLAAVNLGLRTIPVERRRHRHRDTRLLAFLNGVAAAAELGLKEHDRLMLARQMLERRLIGRRTSSKLPALIDLVLSRPLVSTGMIAQALDITPRAALRIVEELNLRELTGRGRFRAWGVL